MRVIAGTAGSLKLMTVASMDTRPTTDRIKETLFNILSPDIPGCRFLDLFSGSGAIAIEALSRGADEAYLVESNVNALKCIERNLEFTHLKDRAHVLRGDVLTETDVIERQGVPFDIIFMDPPYGRLLEKQVFYKLSGSVLIDDDTIIVVESDLDTGFDYVEELGFQVYRIKKYKTNKHTFICRRKEAEEWR